MAYIVADMVRERSTTTGTGAITPSGAYSAAYGTIGAALSSGDTAHFGVRDSSGNWNVFLGTWNGTTVARTTILAGSDGTNAVTLTGSGQEIWIGVASAWFASRPDAAAMALSALGTISGAQTLNLATAKAMLAYTASGAVAFTISAVPSGFARAILIKHKQDGTGGRALTFTAGGGVPTIKYAGGSAPDFTGRAAGAVDVVSVWSDGTDVIVSPGITDAS